MKLQHKFKPGDKVRLISLRKVGFETLHKSFKNWAKEETPKLKVNEAYTVDGCLENAITLEKYQYAHPYQKFKKVRS